MNAGATSERVYDALKQRVLSGALIPGDKIDPASVADDLNSSVTPVRDALHRLVGERLAESRASEGFHLPLVTEPALRDLYAWNGQVLRLTIQGWPRDPILAEDGDYGPAASRSVAALFDRIASGSPNSEHVRQIRLVNDRLAAARNAEEKIFDDIPAELRAIETALNAAATTCLLKLIRTFHRRRLHATPRILRVLYRN